MSMVCFRFRDHPPNGLFSVTAGMVWTCQSHAWLHNHQVISIPGGGCHYSMELLPLHAHVADNCTGQDIIQMSSMYNYVAACEGRPVTASHCLRWCLQEMQLNPANSRWGRVCIIPTVNIKTSGSVRSQYYSSLAVRGPRFFNSIPPTIENITEEYNWLFCGYFSAILG